MRALLLIAALTLTGCATTQTEWKPQPVLQIEGTFDGVLTLHDPRQAPPEHPGWRILDRALGLVVPIVGIYEGSRIARNPPTVVQAADPILVRPEIVRPEIVRVD